MTKKQHQAAAAAPDPSAALETMKTLQVELRRIRSLVKEIAAAYIPRLESRAEEVSGRLKEATAADAGELKQMLLKIRRLSVKPQKGRRKDLKKMEALLEELSEDADRVVERSEKISAASSNTASEKKRRHGRAGKS